MERPLSSILNPYIIVIKCGHYSSNYSFNTSKKFRQTGDQMLSVHDLYALDSFGIPIPSMVKIAIANCQGI